MLLPVLVSDMSTKRLLLMDRFWKTEALRLLLSVMAVYDETTQGNYIGGFRKNLRLLGLIRHDRDPPRPESKRAPLLKCKKAELKTDGDYRSITW